MINVADDRLQQYLRDQFVPREISLLRPPSDFPQQTVVVPDEWDTVQLAPWYDLHVGHHAHDAATYERHLHWFAETPNVLGWLGGDIIENATKLSVGAGVYEQDFTPDNQLVTAMGQLARVRHKLLFSLPGNHEARSNIVGLNPTRFLSMMTEVPYYSDYCFSTLKWRGNNFRILAHHGAGGAQTAGAQRMAARKDIAWAKPVDLYWTGHLHNPLVDPLFQTDVDQATGEMFERTALVIISPSYLKYFGTYAAANRYPPGQRGLAVVELHPDGRMDSVIHARGRRL